MDDPASMPFPGLLGVDAWPEGRRRAIRRTPAELPADARAAVERFTVPTVGGAYRSYDPAAQSHGAAWYPIIVRPPPARGRALFWPAVRTAVPASASVMMASSVAFLALNPAGLVGAALGSVLGAVVARTQYRLERDEQALASLWLSSDYSRVLLGRYESLGDRLRGKPRWHVAPLGALAGDPREVVAPPDLHGEFDEHVLGAFRRWHARTRRVGHVLAVLGIDPTTVDGPTAERVYTLYRLARLRRAAQQG